MKVEDCNKKRQKWGSGIKRDLTCHEYRDSSSRKPKKTPENCQKDGEVVRIGSKKRRNVKGKGCVREL